MPGYGFEDDELQKLFAEAGEAVKKAKTTPPAETPRPTPPPAPVAPPPAAVTPPPAAAPPPPAPVAAEEEVELDIPAPAPRPAAAPPAPAAAGGEVRLLGGEQTDAALVGRTQAGASVTLPWNQIRHLSLGRVVDRNVLAFMCGGTLYYFNDENVAYKGLLKQMAATLAMNWRTLANELAAQVSDKSDAGIQAVTGAGGMVPKFLDIGGFFNTVRSK